MMTDEKTSRHFLLRNRRTRERKPVDGGFTLMEILLAVFIFGLMVSVIYGTFIAVVGSAGSIEEDIDLHESAKICMDRFVTDLRAIYVAMPPLYVQPGMNSDPDPYRFQGSMENVGGKEFPMLRFTSYAHLPIMPGPAAGIVELSYYVAPAEENGFVLKRSDRHYPYPLYEKKPEDPILCEKVRSLTFKYIDDLDEPRDEWDSESDMTDYATPRCVVIELELGDEERSDWFRTAVDLPLRRKAAEQ